jgi:hypothetical protein
MAFVPITIPIRPTKPSDTAPRIMPREELSAAAATTIGIVAFNEGEALAFKNKLGTGVPEKLILLLMDCEKLPNTDIDIERLGEIDREFDREFDILDVRDSDGLAVLPGEGETVLLAALDILSDDDDVLVCVMLEVTETEELAVCDRLDVNDDDTLSDGELDCVCELDNVKEGDILSDGELDRVCEVDDVNDDEELAVCVIDGVTEAIIHV